MAEKSKQLTVKKNYLPVPVAPSGANGLDKYIKFSNKVPMLSAEEEKELALKLRQQNDLDSAQKLILSHLRFVNRIARSFSGYGLPVADLIQEGNVGLMKAVKRFNPDIGVRLASFAVHWIKAEMHEYILKNWRIVKVATTKPQRKLFFNLRSSKKRFGWFTKEEVEAVAKDLDVKPEVVIEMEKRMNAYDMAFDAPNENSDDDVFTPSMFIEDKTMSPETVIAEEENQVKMHQTLQCAISKLDNRSKEIITKRWLGDKKETLHDLAGKYNLSAERVRQLEVIALDKLKSLMKT